MSLNLSFRTSSSASTNWSGLAWPILSEKRRAQNEQEKKSVALYIHVLVCTPFWHDATSMIEVLKWCAFSPSRSRFLACLPISPLFSFILCLPVLSLLIYSLRISIFSPFFSVSLVLFNRSLISLQSLGYLFKNLYLSFSPFKMSISLFFGHCASFCLKARLWAL